MKPFMRQTWRDLTFLHWPYEPAAVRPLIPRDLELDLFGGKAWIGLVPFSIVDLTAPRAPAIPWLSHFAETNVRTYVRNRRGEPGVWFFSLDAARLPAVIGARLAYALPYFWAKMSVERNGNRVIYRSRRRHGPPASSDMEIGMGGGIPRHSELEVFLTNRLCLYAKRGQNILKADIEHAPWPLRRAHVLSLNESLISATGLTAPTGEPHAHFSASLDVLVGWPQPS